MHMISIYTYFLTARIIFLGHALTKTIPEIPILMTFRRNDCEINKYTRITKIVKIYVIVFARVHIFKSVRFS